MKWADLVGTWRYARRGQPDGIGWFQYFADGRIYTPVHDDLNPKLLHRAWLRGNIELPDTLRVFSKADEIGWSVSFVLDGERLRLGGRDETVHLCTRVALEAAPLWFQEDIAAAISSSPP